MVGLIALDLNRLQLPHQFVAAVTEYFAYRQAGEDGPALL